MKSFVRITGGLIGAWLLVLSASLPAADEPPITSCRSW